MEAPPCGDAVYAAGRFISSVHYAIMELPELLYFSLPAPDSAFLLTAVIKTPLLTQSTVEKKTQHSMSNPLFIYSTPPFNYLAILMG